MPKSVKYRFTTFSQLSVREKSKNYFGVTLSNPTVSFNKKTKEHNPTENGWNWLLLVLWIHWFADDAPKYTRDQFTKLRQVTARHIRKEA